MIDLTEYADEPREQGTAIPSVFRELDSRENCGIKITLEWNGADESLWVFCMDSEEPMNDRAICVQDHAQAYETFQHPYAYSSERKIEAP